ncbi:MAG: hypothetical protein ACRDNF_15205 [Streptosporangiaceae bacterium]
MVTTELLGTVIAASYRWPPPARLPCLTAFGYLGWRPTCAQRAGQRSPVITPR